MSASSGTGKICVKCGEDCSAKPRTKDSHGRYYCQACYDAAKSKQAVKSVSAAAASKPMPKPMPKKARTDNALLVDGPDDGPLNMLDKLVSAAPPVVMAMPCPGCGTGIQGGSVICTNCGYNVQTGKQLSVKKSKTPSEKRELPPIAATLLSPMAIALLAMGAYGLFYFLAGDTAEGALLFTGWHLVFSFGVGIFVLVLAFMYGIGTGLLTMLVPFYSLIFVYGKCDNAYAKVLFPISIIGNVIWIASFEKALSGL